MALLEIDGKRYEQVLANEATLGDLIALKRQTGLGMAELQALVGTFEGLEPDDLERLIGERPELMDDVLLAMGISVWLTRRRAGESLTLDEACSMPLDSIRSIPEPGDRKPKREKGSSADPR